VINVMVDPARSQIGTTMAAHSSPWSAWVWLLHEYATLAQLRRDDVLWIRFPSKFLALDQNEFWNDRVEVLRELAGTVKGFRILPYMLPPPGDRPAIENGLARSLHDACRGGIAWDSSVLRPPPCRRTVIEPCWMLEAPWNHGHDAVITEDEYRERFNPQLETLEPLKRGRTLHVLMHRVIPMERWNRAGVFGEMADFAGWVTVLNTRLAPAGQRRVVPVFCLDHLVDYRIAAAEAEGL